MTEQAQREAARNALVAERFVDLAAILVGDFDVVRLMDRLVESCVKLFDTDAVGLLLADASGRLQVVASSSDEIRLLELFQLQNDEGPCLDCVRSAQSVHVEDLETSRSRWPVFMEAAQAHGFTSVHAVPLRLGSETLGGLNIFATASSALRPEDQRVAQALADFATIGLLQQRSLHRANQLAEQLQMALNSRIVIEQAKGVLAEFGNVDMAAAYDALRTFARNHNLKIAEASAQVVRRTVDLDSVVVAGPEQLESH